MFGLMAGLALAGCGGSSSPKGDAATDAKKDGSTLDAGTTKRDALPPKLDTGAGKLDTAPGTDARVADTGLADTLPVDGTTRDTGVAKDAGIADTQPGDTTPAVDAPLDVASPVDVAPAVDAPIVLVDAAVAEDASPDLMPDTQMVPMDTAPAVDSAPATDALPVVFSDNFTDGNSTGWIATASSGTMPDTYWSVSDVDGNPALVQDSSISTTRRYMYFNPAGDAGTYTLGDLSAQAKVQIQARNIATYDYFGAKVCARYDDNGTGNAIYCVAIFPGNTANTGILRILKGNATLGTAVTGLDLSMDTWYTVKIVVSGTTTTTIQAYLDGELLATATDTTSPLLTGFAAVGTTGCRAAFDDIVVTTP